MGSQIEMIKDQEGNSHLIFDKSALYDDSKIGDNVENFQNLRYLGNMSHLKGQNQNNYIVAKVRSLINHKIYVMSSIDLNKLSKQVKILLFNQIEKLKSLNHPHILKYYKEFTDQNEYLYIIMEYMNNSDLQSFIKAHQILKTKIKEEEIWNILLQCLSALEYLRKENVYELGIKLANIYLNNEQNIKLGLFNKIPDLKDKDYDIKEDVRELGLFIFKMCYSQFEFTINKIIKVKEERKTIKDGKEVKVEEEVEKEVYTDWNNDFPIKKEKNTDYSPELLNIVFEMIEEDINKRLSSEDLYNKVKDEYVKKYSNNASIKAVLRCLYSFPTFTKSIFDEKDKIIQNKEKRYINYLFLETVEALSSNTNINGCLEDFRRALASENSKLDCSKEVDPVYILAFILEKIHKEGNIINTEIVPEKKEPYIITPIHRAEEIDRSKEHEIEKFESYVKRNLNSTISKLFFSVMKTKRNCKVCRSCVYSFSNNFFFIFDVSKMGKKRENQPIFDILIDGFRRQHKENKIIKKEEYHLFCDTCLTEQDHNEFNRFYSFAEHLIICFYRGKNYEYDKKIDVKEELIFVPKKYPEKEGSFFEYYLVGSVIRESKKDKFLYFSREPKEKNNWLDSNGNLENKPIEKIMKAGDVIMLFYTAKK